MNREKSFHSKKSEEARRNFLTHQVQLITKNLKSLRELLAKEEKALADAELELAEMGGEEVTPVDEKNPPSRLEQHHGMVRGEA